MKRILAILLAILLCFIMIVPTSLAEEEILDIPPDEAVSDVIDAPVEELSEPLVLEVDLDEIV